MSTWYHRWRCSGAGLKNRSWVLRQLPVWLQPHCLRNETWGPQRGARQRRRSPVTPTAGDGLLATLASSPASSASRWRITDTGTTPSSRPISS